MITNVKSGLLKIFVFVFIGLVAVMAGSLGKAISNKYFNEQAKNNINDLLLEVANELNKSLPKLIDSETNWKNVSASNRTLRYNYEFINYSSSDISEDDINADREYVINNFCAENGMNQFRDNDVTVEYAYHGNDSKQITIISISPSDCYINE